MDPEHPEMPRIANVRIIGTTSQILDNRAQAGLFNVELLEKMNFFRIEMPPLSQRKDEFEDIALGLVKEIARELQKDHLRFVAPLVWEKLKSYDWPGNLRELRNVLRFAVISAKGDRIEVEDLPDFHSSSIDFRSTREEFEKTYILELLKTFNWEIDRTCKMTHIDKNILLNKIKTYGISLENKSSV